MNKKRWMQASLAVFAGMWVLESLVHGVLLQNIYHQTPSVWRNETDMHGMMGLMWLGYAIFAVFFTLLYDKGYESKKPGVEQGLRFGLYVGLAFAPMQNLVWYVVLPIPGALAFYWFLAGMVECVVLGALAGLIYKKSTK